MRGLFIDTSALRRFPEFRRLWFGLMFSQLGTQLGVVAVAYQVYRVTGSVFDVGLVGLIQLGPVFLTAVIGGSLADAVNRRTLLIIAETTITLCAVGLALNSLSGKGSLLILYLLAACTAAASGIDNPTRTALVVSIVGRDALLSATSVRQITQQMSIVVGPSLGGILLGSFSVTDVYWVQAASFLVALTTVTRLRSRPPTAEASRFGLASIAEGFAYFKGRQVLKACFATDLNAMVLGTPSALYPAFGLTVFHGGARAVGLLFAAPGIGALLAGALSGWSRNIRRPGLAVCVAVSIWGAAIVGFGLSRSLPVGMVFLAVAGMADVSSVLFFSTIIQMETPDRLRGRISAIQMALLSNGPRLGNMEAGTVAALGGIQLSVVTGGLGCILGMAVIAKTMPQFVRYELGDKPRGELATSES